MQVVTFIDAVTSAAELWIAMGCRRALMHEIAGSNKEDILVAVLLDYTIPFVAGFAFLVSCVLTLRFLARRLEGSCCAGERRRRFGRKGLIVSTASLLFVTSCFYRSIFVADEGAFLCRGPASIFNAPAAGRLIATIGEIALVVQISVYLDDTARRLNVQRGLWASRKRFTYAPVIAAECLSWSGVITGLPKFFCCEYIVWMLLATTWIWDSGELLHKSLRWGDAVGHACLLVTGMSLLLFNAFVEIPHFFIYEKSAHEAKHGWVFECHQDAESQIWHKRLPFFFAYFFLCSWFSVGMSFRYFLRGHYGKQNKLNV
eukprot:gnl/TRDRNA2_/TRDRNA2_182944_c0_seq1.p1 gnl/TRDRNA2_/TRDRNA2_182944_c0~~gnl/TRDRNA2_/TRDRNA2_182944_c0_seq1.p1  ORF type:complete len:316 (+),score=42.04 gnl/TRDRNA2_/TRDRNA2_182944_c0_seq1:63-1010(+)